MFKRLLRHFSRGIVDNDLISRADLHGPIAGIISALLMASAGVTLMFLGKYNSVAFDQRRGFIPAHSQTLAEKLAMALDDRALLIGGAMLVMGLLVVIWWDALGLERMLPSSLMGLVLGWVAWASGSVLPAMLLHACHNALLGLLLVRGTEAIPDSWFTFGALGAAAGAGLLLVGRRSSRL